MPDPNDYIELNRQFVELNAKEVEISESEAWIKRETTYTSRWSDLLNQNRVVILSSARTGKTQETFHQCQKLDSDGKSAFFLRLEDLAVEWETAFEIGNAQGFEQAVGSGHEIWIFLDSIDEARLTDPGALRRALKRLKLHVTDNLQNVHMILTSRVGAWRPKDDAAQLDSLFPYNPPRRSSSDREEDEDMDIEWNHGTLSDFSIPQVEGDNGSSIKFYTLHPLNSDQMLYFAKKRGLQDADALVSEINQRDMQGFAGRPKDLDDLIQFWRDNGRLGSRREIIKKNINRKLNEDNQNRAEKDPLSIQTALTGAKKLSAAVALTHHSKIFVPEGYSSGNGISAQSILEDWSPKECSTLLGRPIFEPETYGFVRFDHRDSREFLAASWFFDLMECGQSRMRVEQLFFKIQYGIEVVVPSLRPILPWLALLDHGVRRRLMDKWPEILLEGGDPSGLPVDDRKKLLTRFCELHVSPGSQFSVDGNALQHLVTPELGTAIRNLYKTYRGNKEIEILLLQSIELGSLRDLADIARRAALKPSSIYTRLVAMRALSSVCDEKGVASACDAILEDNNLTSRRELATLLHVFGKHIPAKSLMSLIEAVEPKKSHRSGHLSRAIINYLNTRTIEDVRYIVSESARLIKQAPFIERRFFEASEKNFWMLGFALTACEQLIKARHPATLCNPCLSLLSLTHVSQDYNVRETETDLRDLVSQWPDLNAALFWHNVEDSRALLDKDKGERLISWQQAGASRVLWHFENKDINQVVGWVTQKEFVDDRLVALTLAFFLYRAADRPQSLRRHLWKVVEGHEELNATLKRLLNPLPMSGRERRYRNSEANWKRRRRERERRDADYHSKWRAEIPKSLEEIRGNRVPPEGKIWDAQLYLFDRMRSLDSNHNRWAQTNWLGLEEEVGREAAEAMRDGLMAIWRRYDPALASEVGGVGQSILRIETMALSGLEIEFQEVLDWTTTLDHTEAQKAARYLMKELNGFPTWFREFEAQHPDVTLSTLLKEAVWELYETPVDEPSHYFFARVLWNAAWFGDRIAPCLVDTLIEKEPSNISVLSYALPLVMGCNAIENDQIAELCAGKVASATTPPAHQPLWYAAWVSVDPSPAISNLTAKLAALEDEEAVKTAIAFINALYGSHREHGLGVRDGHKTPEHLRKLYDLMHQYIRREDDIDRSNGEVHSPTSRDDAQDARGYIYNDLADISGKAAFDALVGIANQASSEHNRKRLYSRAIARAQADSDVRWTTDNVNEFAVELERMPSTPYELFEVARNRLMDLKNNYEKGDTSPSDILIKVDGEVALRNYLANELMKTAHARYSISQEDEMPNGKRTDIRFVRAGLSSMVPVELKIAGKWSSPQLFEKLKNQLCGDYMKDAAHGIYLIFHFGKKAGWKHPHSGNCLSFKELISALQCDAYDIVASESGISNIEVIGIDLTKRNETM